MSKPWPWVVGIAAVSIIAGILAVTTAKPMASPAWAFAGIAAGVFVSLIALHRAWMHWRARSHSYWKVVRAGLCAATGIAGLLAVLLFFEMAFWHPDRVTVDGDFVTRRWTTMGVGGDYGTNSLFFRDRLVVERVDKFERHPSRENLIIVSSYSADDIEHHTHVFDGETFRLLRVGPMAFLSEGLDGWSPDETRLVIDIRQNLYLVDLDEWRADPLSLAGQERHTTRFRGWSPDSQRFAVTASGSTASGFGMTALQEWDAATRVSRHVGCMATQRGVLWAWQDGEFAWYNNRLVVQSTDANESVACP
jgi:hypothetical protein